MNKAESFQIYGQQNIKEEEKSKEMTLFAYHVLNHAHIDSLEWGLQKKT